MRILEQSKDVLTLKNSTVDSIGFWFGNICLLFSCLLLIIVLIAAPSGWWSSLCLVLLAVGFVSALINTWASDVVKVCSFNKTLSKITIQCYGLQAKTKNFPFQDVRAVEVRKSTGYAYGVVLESAQLWVITGRFGAILLSDRNGGSEAIANQIREFLSLKSRSL